MLDSVYCAEATEEYTA